MDIVLVIVPCAVLITAPAIAAHLWATRAIALKHLNHDSPEWLLTAIVICTIVACIILVSTFVILQPNHSKILAVVIVVALMFNFTATQDVKNRIVAARKKFGWRDPIKQL